MTAAIQQPFIFVTGGVVSSLGKGVASGAMMALLEGRGLRVTPLKMDPYLNVDPGTMNPYQHGEVYVTDDGFETDLDLGHYERFSNREVEGKYSVTTGQVYSKVLERERHGDYQGATVQVIPHITDEIKARILAAANESSDLVLVEVGGTVGDIESQPFLEAIRQLRLELPRSVLAHLTLIPRLRSTREFKTKPTQHSVRELRTAGLQPDLLLCRCDDPLDRDARSKISLFCNIRQDSVFSLPDVSNIYTLPLQIQEQGLDVRLGELLRLPEGRSDLSDWADFYERAQASERAEPLRVGMVGKYVALTDAYKSLNEALEHAGTALGRRTEIRYIDSDDLDEGGLAERLDPLDAVVVPGGFGERGVEGMIAAARHCRERGIPTLGICLGLHIMVIEAARHQLGLAAANSTEFEEGCATPAVALVTEWVQPDGAAQKRTAQDDLGGTMRLGAQVMRVAPGTLLSSIYGEGEARERHRHRYEIHPKIAEKLVGEGWVVSGRSLEDLVEVMELPRHPWYLGCQFHPEFKSTPRDSHPLFLSFLKAAAQAAGAASSEAASGERAEPRRGAAVLGEG